MRGVNSRRALDGPVTDGRMHGGPADADGEKRRGLGGCERQRPCRVVRDSVGMAQPDRAGLGCLSDRWVSDGKGGKGFLKYSTLEAASLLARLDC